VSKLDLKAFCELIPFITDQFKEIV